MSAAGLNTPFRRLVHDLITDKITNKVGHHGRNTVMGCPLTHNAKSHSQASTFPGNCLKTSFDFAITFPQSQHGTSKHEGFGQAHGSQGLRSVEWQWCAEGSADGVARHTSIRFSGKPASWLLAEQQQAYSRWAQGSGKTTLLQHILRSEHGLKIAVIVNDIGAVNVDASLIRNTHRLTKTEEKVIALQNGCICCTLRGDLLEELVRLSEIAEFDYIIIESSGISEPEQVAETFDARLAEQISELGSTENGLEGLDKNTLSMLQRLKEAGGLEKFARLDTTVTVIDAFTIFHDFETADLLSSRRDDVVPEDERTVSDLMVDQIEFADVVVLNKTDMVDRNTRERILDLIARLNHRAKVVETSYGKIDVKRIVNTGMFNLEKAQVSWAGCQVSML